MRRRGREEPGRIAGVECGEIRVLGKFLEASPRQMLPARTDDVKSVRIFFSLEGVSKASPEGGVGM
jgi:hypothetical protein